MTQLPVAFSGGSSENRDAFERVEDAALTVSEIIAAGILPAALEICDKRFMEILEAHLPSGYPTDKAAMLIVELDGERDDVARETPALEKVLRRWDPAPHRGRRARTRRAVVVVCAAGFALRATGKAFYVCDSTVPRQRVLEMMARSRQIAASHGLEVPILGHAGDGNLHPVVLDEAGQLATVDATAEEIACGARIRWHAHRRARHRHREAGPHAPRLRPSRTGCISRYQTGV